MLYICTNVVTWLLQVGQGRGWCRKGMCTTTREWSSWGSWGFSRVGIGSKWVNWGYDWRPSSPSTLARKSILILYFLLKVKYTSWKIQPIKHVEVRYHHIQDLIPTIGLKSEILILKWILWLFHQVASTPFSNANKIYGTMTNKHTKIIDLKYKLKWNQHKVKVYLTLFEMFKG